ncbi:MAG TPA: hypothetical protein VK327_07395 [Candidatus Paceibacterota bacterium]|nr:hypothetical protein [Candidatus Paceibacterota bacterium]
MKKLIASLIAVTGLAHAASAAVLLNEPFDYTDGSLITTSSGLWFTHSGTAGQVDVASGAINITGLEGEDVSRAISPPNSYSTNTLYGSFKVNFSALPSGTATYFAHFSQSSTTFRCKIFSTVTGAAAGKFRLGVANGAANVPAVIATDLDLGTDYKLVFRLISGTNATLWINPTSESSAVSRADGTDATTLGSYVSTNFSFRQANGIGTMVIDNLLIGEQFSDVQTVGGPPSISGLVATSIPGNSNTGPLPFVVSDVETAAGSLTVSATSDNPTLVPNSPANLTFGGADGNRTLTVTPAVGQQGTANIEVVVTDGNNDTATNSFLLTVGAPTISGIPNQIAPLNGVISVPMWVNDSETAAGSLVVTATSSDQGVLPDANIGIVNSGSTNRTLWLTNTAAGLTTITVTVNDGTFNIPTTFLLTAYPDNGIYLTENFDAINGPISSATAVAPDWNTHSPALTNSAVGQTLVTNGKLILVNTNIEDINRWFSAPPTSTSGVLLHTRFVLNLSALPTKNGVGEYFAHAYAFSGTYRGRIFTTTNGAAPGKFRISVSNGGYVTTVFPQDFGTNENHVVITRMNTGTCDTTLWVDPTSENSTHVTATDVWAPASTYYGYAFRQEPGIGTMSIDDLLIGSTFDEVFLTLAPTPEPIAIQQEAGNLIMSWNQAAFSLASSTNVAGPYEKISGATSPYTNSISSGTMFFRLVYP